jgi:hypothetical protein
MDGNNIIIKQSYFTNIQTAINSLNEFCSSGFRVKNFPVLDGDFQLDPLLERILSRLDSVDPTWLEDEGKLNGIIEMINENIAKIDPVDGVYETIVSSNNEMMIKAIDAYIGFKLLQVIADNFQDFIRFVNGIYTFEIFTKPDQYSDVLDKFGQFIPLNEIPELDLEEKIFDEGFYVDGVFKNEQIELPESMDEGTETERIINRAPLQGVEVFVDDSVQEAAEVNYFTETKPKHMKYSTKMKKWLVSNQFEKTVNDLVAGLRKCDSTDDLTAFFKSDFWRNMRDLSDTIIPYILVKVFDNPKKFNGKFNTENYSKSYASIIKQNNGAKRFQNYDIFTTFKSDKEGTIKFIEDFLKLNLVNDPDASISNNTLLTLFNIFDSRIYLDIVYNYAPDSVKKEKTEDQFVKEVRGKINKNSRTAKTYTNDQGAQDPSPDDKVDDSKTVSEYVVNELNKLGDMSISDMMACEQFSHIVECDIDTLCDKMYNSGLSPFLVEEYIGESFYDIDSQVYDVFEEASMKVKRDAFQQGVCSLMANMEEIVKLDKEHRWNANTLGSRYKTTYNPVAIFLFPIFTSVTASSEEHTNIKQVYHSTKQALKGKRGSFTSEQLQTLQRLHDLTGDLWGTVKMFWTNPRNWFKMLNVMKNDKTQKRTKEMADIAREIVALKPKLSFIIDNDDFVNEYWYDGSAEYVFQEATTEKNRERLRTAVNLVMRDMQKISDLAKKKQWTNNACISIFKDETKGNVKEALKYANRGATGSCGKFQDQEVNVLKSFGEKLSELLKTVKSININPLIGKNVKEAGNVHKVATLANDILGMKGELEFINSEVVKDSDGPAVPTEHDIKSESFEYNIDTFKMIMEQETGGIPEYMKTRFKMTDKVGATVTPTALPEGVPQNPVPEITDSIDAKLDAGGDNLGDMIGAGFENNPNKDKVEGKIVVNVTNNYTNSFNRDSNNTTTNTTTNDDHSTGKTTNTTNSNSNNKSNSDNDNSHDNQTDSSSNKSVKKTDVKKSKTDNSDRSHSTSTKGSNNNNNSNDSADLKDSPTFKDGEQKLSSGKTVQEMFMFLESEEPQSTGNTATRPKEDLLTKAMDHDRKTLATQQKAKHGVQKIANTGKAVLKPVTRTKQWLTKVVDSLIKRDEDKVKAALIENRSYRSAVYKASRLAIKLGLISVAFSIQPYLGLTVAGIEGLKLADRNRLKKEVQQEMESELEIIDEKIKDLNSMNTPEARKEKYEYMRMKKKIEEQMLSTPRRKVASSYWDAY